MLENHLKIAFRSLGKRKGFSLINIIGLALGIWCTLLIALWISDELDKDSFHGKGDRISQVMTNVSSEEGGINTWDGTGYPVAEALAEKIPRQSTLQFDAVVPLDNFLPMNNKSWGNTWVATYALHAKNTDLDALGRKIKKLPEEAGDDVWRTLRTE